jgi:hypothetical protein
MVRFIILVVIFPIGLSCCFNLWSLLISIYNTLDTNFYFIAGSIFSVVVMLLFKKKLNFFTTFEHELTHNIWAVLFFRKPMGFHVRKDGSGLFEYESGSRLSNVFISLSPYFFPTACFLWLPFYVLCKEQFYWFYFLFMGVFFGYHIVSTLQETKLYQTDITSNGIIYSFLLLFPLNVIFNGIILAHLHHGFKGIFNFLFMGHLNNLDLILTIL